LFNNTKINTKGFTLIELLVVVAILGILSALGVVSYNGYVSATKKTSTENAMLQISLAQTEEYSNTGSYYENEGCDSPGVDTSEQIEANLLGGANVLTKVNSEGERKAVSDYDVCIAVTASGYEITAVEDVKDKDDAPCTITLNHNSVWTRENC
jgi:type IV pilus assembly protein PilE